MGNHGTSLKFWKQRDKKDKKDFNALLVQEEVATENNQKAVGILEIKVQQCLANSSHLIDSFR